MTNVFTYFIGLLSIINYNRFSYAYIDFTYESYDYSEDMNSIYNIPIIPSVTSVSWDPDTKILPVCVELNNHTIENSLIESAIDNVNLYLYSGNIDTTSLFLYDYKYTNEKCPDDDLKIKIIKSNNTLKSPGYY